MHKKDIIKNHTSVIHDDYHWKSYDGLSLYGQIWKSNEKPKAILYLVHSIHEHSSRYDIWAGKFVNRGYFVVGIDLRGHGRSDGGIGFKASYRKILKDIEILYQQGNQHFPELPVVFYGHGLGANLIVNYLISRHINVRGFILSSPWFELKNKISSSKLFMLSILRHFIPNVLINSPVVADNLSRNQEIVEKYRNDQLINNKISLNSFYEIYEFGLKASKCIYKLNMPLLVLHGSGDNVTSCSASKDFVLNASKSTNFKEWYNNYHELHNDLESDSVFEYIVAWLDGLFN